MTKKRAIASVALAAAITFTGSSAYAATAPNAPAATKKADSAATSGTIVGPSGATYKAPEFTTMQTWSICSPGDATYELVRMFNRVAKSGSSAGSTPLYCGPESTNGWGERHIRTKHQGQWEYYSSLSGSASNWRTFTDWAMNEALLYPASVTTNTSNNTWTYKTQLQIRDTRGTIRGVFYVYVVVDRGTSQSAKKIITSYPSAS